MAFNHYAKIKRILADYDNWYIVRVDEPTSAKNFKGQIKKFDHYYRVYSKDGEPIKFCKFQQLDLFEKTMSLSLDNLLVAYRGLKNIQICCIIKTWLEECSKQLTNLVCRKNIIWSIFCPNQQGT